MKKFYVTLLAAALSCNALQAAPQIKSPASLQNEIAKTAVRGIDLEKRTANEKRTKAKKHAAPVSRVVAGPSDTDKAIEETPEGTLTQCVKNGGGYSAGWFAPSYISLDGTLTAIVISPDGKKIYMQNPISAHSASKDNWIVGEINGKEATFTFPQLLDIDIYYDDDDNIEDIYRDYAVIMEFVVRNEEEQSGWYYPAENQTYKFQLNDDGTLTSLEGKSIMIGLANWIEGEDLKEGEEPYWNWYGSGDFITDIVPITEKTVEVPADVKFEEWQLFSEYSSRPVMVGFNGNECYIKGFLDKRGMKEAAVLGKVENNKVVFENGQYMGIYERGGSVTYFLTGNTTQEKDEDGDLQTVFVKGENLTFDYDATAKILSTEGAYCVSTSKEKIIYYVIEDKPYLSVPAENFTVKSLITPILSSFYDVDEDYDDDAEFYFIIPTIDADKNILPTDRLAYQVILDDEIFTFFNDEYELPEGVTETTEIPYGYESEDSYDFMPDGNEQGFTLHSRGFESLGVRSVYTPEEGDPVYSAVLWAPGYEGKFESNAINGISVEKTITAVAYYDLNGLRVERPAKGIYVMRATLSDGSTITRKIASK